MLAIGIVLAVYLCTYVGCNAKLDGSAKAGFFVTFAIVAVIIGVRTHQTVDFFANLAVRDNNHPDTANASTFAVGRFEIYRSKISHIYSVCSAGCS